MLSISISSSISLSLSLHRLSVFAFIDFKTDTEEFLREDLRLMYVFPGAVYSFNGRSIVIIFLSFSFHVSLFTSLPCTMIFKVRKNEFKI